MENVTAWTPTAPMLNLNDGPLFLYTDSAISAISNTEAFNTGIDKRDSDRCIVCGRDG